MSSPSTVVRPAFQYDPPRWSTGHIMQADAAFLAALVEDTSPAEMLEVGVASGCSSAVLLQALSRVDRQPGAAAEWLYSFDVAERCYFDASHRVGDAVHELTPDLRAHWRLTLGDALAARHLLRGRNLRLAFIDADHRHPWPTLDLLAILPTLRARAWVALHDIRLPELGRGPLYDNHGAQVLFDAWPWTKRDAGNIGAIRLDASPAEIHTRCLGVLERPWEASVPRAVLRALGLPHQGRMTEDSPADRAIAVIARARHASRPLIIWSAGQAGREFLSCLRDEQVPVDAFVDTDPRKQTQVIEGLDVRPPETLFACASDSGSRRERPFVAVCGIYAAEIRAELDARGFVAEVDYVIV